MLELLAGVLIAALGAYVVLLPVLRPPAPDTESATGGDEGDDPADDLSPQAVALRALKEIEFDRATGKLSDADYEALKAKYTGEALAALRGEPAGAPAAPAPAAQRAPAVAGATRVPACEQHGRRPEADAQFCSDCGRRLGSAPGYCVRCGSALDTDARYCNRCGARVAA